MATERRPKCISVIGWAWIIIGGMMIVSSVAAIVAFNTMTIPESRLNDSWVLRMIPVFIVLQVMFAASGLYSGVHFLRLKPWSRQVLEVQSWVLLMLLIAFAVYWQVDWQSTVPSHVQGNRQISGAIMGGVMMLLYIVPLGIMIKTLRGDVVRVALAR